jgi:hypothetical protein
MSEHEMRLRAFRFLKVRMRNMIMPATVGIGLAVGGGCGGSHPPMSVRYAAPVSQDAAGRADVFGITIYSAPMDAPAADGLSLPMSDALGFDLAQPGPDGGASVPDTAPDVLALDGAPSPDADSRDLPASEVSDRETPPLKDAGVDHGLMKYGSPFFDANPSDATIDLGNNVGKYMAVTPDAASEANPALRYQPPMVDAATAGNPALLYMAQLPKGA